MVLAPLLAAVALLSPSAQTVEWKRTDDGSGAFADAYFKKAEEDPELLDRTKRLPTLFFYWKARWLLNFEVGPWERAHLNISRIVLEVLDPESGAALKKILDTHPADKSFAVKDEETEDFLARLAVFAGIDKGLDSKPKSKLEKWEFDVGISLGDLAGKVVQYHDTHTIPTAQRMFNETLDGFKDRLEDVPEGANAKTLAAIKVISETPRKEEYSPAEIKTLSTQIKAALMTVIP